MNNLNPILLNIENLNMLIFRFALDLIFTTILIFGIYYRLNRKTKFLFSFYIFNTLIFFLASLLSQITMETGFAFGLFAIFSILRYRTKQIPIKEMSYLFVTIIMATINSTVTSSLSYAEVLFANLVIIAVCFAMEKIWAKKYRESQIVEYEKIDLIKPDNKEELFMDLQERTGRPIDDIEIKEIDFLTDSATLKVYYKE